MVVAATSRDCASRLARCEAAADDLRGGGGATELLEVSAEDTGAEESREGSEDVN